MKQFCVYILASARNGTIYIGMTSNLEQRIHQHKDRVVDGFTKDYNVNKLVYYEECIDADIATNRERQLKEWRRSWKINLIESNNPQWKDLAEELFDWIPNQVRDDETRSRA